MSQHTARGASEAEIAVYWQEENKVDPPEKFVAQANLTDKAVFERFGLDHFPDCFKEYADLLDWYKRWDVTLDTSNPPFWRWFVGGRINASYNCVDRHLAKHKNKTAIHFVPEPVEEATRHVTYQELFVCVNEVAALLRDFCMRAPPGLLVSRGMRAGTKPRPRTDHRLLRGISSETLHRGGTAQYDYRGSKLGWPLFRSKLSWCPSSPTFECVGERADLAISQ